MTSQISKGKLVVIDGPSGSGKDSLINGLVHALLGQNIPIFSFSEEQLDTHRAEILEARNRGRKEGRTEM